MENKIEMYRKQVGMTQQQLADAVKVRRETIIRLEKGLYNPSLKLAYDISCALCADIYDIFILEKPLNKHTSKNV